MQKHACAMWLVVLNLALGLVLIQAGGAVGQQPPAEPPRPAKEKESAPAKKSAPKKSAKAKKKADTGDAADFEARSHLFFYQPAVVANLAWSPDGTLLATVGSSVDRAGEMTVWNARIAEVLYTIADVAGVRCVRFSPDGKQVVVANPRGQIRVFESATGKPLSTVTEPGHGVLGMAFSRDGKRLATAGADRVAVVWDTASWKKIKMLRGHTNRVVDVAFSADGERLVTTSTDQSAKIWDLASEKAVATLTGHTGEVKQVAVSNDGRLVATASDQAAKVWNAAGGDLKYSIDQVGAVVGRLAFSSDSRVLTAACADGRVRFWDSVDGEALSTLTIHDGQPQAQPGVAGVPIQPQPQPPQPVGLGAIEYTADGKYFAVGGADRTVRIYDAQSQEEVQTLNRDPAEVKQLAPILAMAVSPDRKWVVAALEDGAIAVYDAATGKLRQRLSGHTESVLSLTFSPDGRKLASGGYDQLIKLWDFETLAQAGQLEGHEGPVFGVTFSPDGKTAVSAGGDRLVRIWDVATGREIGLLEGHDEAVLCVAFSPDGKTVASGSSDRSIRLWDLDEKRQTALLEGHEGGVRSVSFHSNGQRLASGGEDRTVKLWDLATGQVRNSLTGHNNLVWCVAFSPQSRTLVSAGADNQIIVWDPQQAMRRSALPGHTQVVAALAFAADGRTLFSASHDGTIRMWRGKQPPASPEAWLENYLTASGEKPKNELWAATLPSAGPFAGRKAAGGRLWVAPADVVQLFVVLVGHTSGKAARQRSRRRADLGPDGQARDFHARRTEGRDGPGVFAEWQAIGDLRAGPACEAIGYLDRQDRARVQGAYARCFRCGVLEGWQDAVHGQPRRRHQIVERRDGRGKGLVDRARRRRVFGGRHPRRQEGGFGRRVGADLGRRSRYGQSAHADAVAVGQWLGEHRIVRVLARRETVCVRQQ
jgi:WD40 repeat protein